MSEVRGVRADAALWAVWRGAAVRQGLSLNAWVVRALRDQVELELALEREAAGDEGADGADRS